MNQEQKPDRFAQIASQQASQRMDSLVVPGPLDLPERYLPLKIVNDSPAQEPPFRPLSKITTPKQLQKELERFRRRYARYLRDVAPILGEKRICLPIDTFNWRLETPEDRVDPMLALSGHGEWDRVTIPHYGGPLGRAKAYYRTGFTLNEEALRKGCLFVHFKGVDYKAHVFVNAAYLGSHEGFFAPFEFDFTAYARPGENTLFVIVENDAICMGNESWGEDGHLYEGDKIYAATGPGWDDPVVGWHHCPPGMGIYQAVSIEARSAQFIQDIFVRPIVEEKQVEAWIEVVNCMKTRHPIQLKIAVFGQNFSQEVQAWNIYQPAKSCGPGVNYYKIPIEIETMRLWSPDTPWLYQLQVRLQDQEGKLLDARSRQFGMRSFIMDEAGEPKGMFYLNGQPIRLRGANTMGFEQQDVMKQDWDQLRDDILLAKICNMNFWRLTQRPVQEEVYEYCDRLGLMTQTDLPLFAVLRRNQFSEAARQAGEMERLVRSHPCNILVTYINEPFPDASAPFTTSVDSSRHLTRPELEGFFQAASQAVLLANPDRVIKPVDGDYYPPAPGLPDNHCYCGWYNGHGVDLGKLHKGYWQPLRPGWYYGCGEFGAEGLDPVSLMRALYPSDWLPQDEQVEADWTPDQILKAQTGMFHSIWFDTQHSMEEWVAASQHHQAWVTKIMSEAFRRDARMVSMAIHLFIDAFPAGWMKAIMDVERQPKPAYFAYQEALTPLMVNLRSDRRIFWEGEIISLEAWILNDLPERFPNANLEYWLEMDGRILSKDSLSFEIAANSPQFAGFLSFPAPEVSRRNTLNVHLGVFRDKGWLVHDTQFNLEIFPQRMQEAAIPSSPGYSLGANRGGTLLYLAETLGADLLPFDGSASEGALLVVDNFSQFERYSPGILAAVEKGVNLVFFNIPPGTYRVLDQRITVIPCGMNPVHFVSRATGHHLVKDFQPDDFKFWYDESVGYVTPLLKTTFTANGWTPILLTGNGGWGKPWEPALAAAEIPFGKGFIRICQVELANRIKTNPVARIFARRLLTVR